MNNSMRFKALIRTVGMLAIIVLLSQMGALFAAEPKYDFVLNRHTNLWAVSGKVIFDNGDTALCRYAPGNITVSGTVFLNPTDSVATLQLAWYIVHPADRRTETVYIHQQVRHGQRFSLQVPWPGIRPNDTLVEVHIGAMLLNYYGNPIMQQGAGIDYYWYPWVCKPPVTTTPSLTPSTQPTNTARPTNTPTKTPRPTNTATNTPRPTNTATSTPTNTARPTNTPTNTPRPTNTPTPTPTEPPE